MNHLPRVATRRCHEQFAVIALIYGGSGCGKSAVAEQLLAGCTHRATGLYYIATMQPDSPEAQARIARHRAERVGRNFTTIECSVALENLFLPNGSAVLLECLGTLLANEMFLPEGSGPCACEAVMRGLEALSRQADCLVVVANDVFADGVAHGLETAEYCRVLAGLNQWLAQRSHVVAEVVCGIPVWLKTSEGWNP